MSGRAWSKDELERLDTYPDAVYDRELSDLFPNRSRTAISLKRRQLREQRTGNPNISGQVDTSLSELDEAILRLARKGVHTIAELADAMDRGPQSIQKSIDLLQERNYRLTIGADRKLEIAAPRPAGWTPIPMTHFTEGRRVRFGVLSDQHMCNRHQRLDVMHAAYDKFEAEGIKEVIVPGNYIDGEATFNRTELIVPPGFERQIAYFVEHYPQRAGITTRILDGLDHEGWYAKREGIEIGRRLVQSARDAGRSDLEYIGCMEADLPFYAEPGDKPAIVRVIHPGGGSCFDDQTEILTEDGWKLFRDLSRAERVATLNRDANELEWQHPHAYTDEPYIGEMLHFKARTFDFLVTPNHRMWTRVSPHRNKRLAVEAMIMPTKQRSQAPENYYDWRFETAESIASAFCRQKWQFQRGGQGWTGVSPASVLVPYLPARRFGHHMKHIGVLTTEDAAELIAWYVTEGNVHANEKSLTICQSKRVNPEPHQRIVNLLRRIGFDPRPRGRDEKDIVVSSRELCRWLMAECGSGSREKHLPRWLKNCSADILRLVFKTMVDGDGWKNGSAFGYRSISSRLLTDFSEVAIKLGFGITEWNGSVNATWKQVYPTINTRPEPVAYAGRVYCVSVPNETILVRRNGRVCWSANSYAMSYKPQKIVESYEGGEKPQVLLIGHYHKSGYFVFRGCHCVLAGTAESQTPFMRNKQLAAHVGFYIIEFQVAPNGSVTEFNPRFFPFFNEGYYVDRYPIGDIPETRVA